jgi:hypothetical protein
MSRLVLMICSLAAILLAQGRTRELFPPDIVPPEVVKGKDALAADPKHYKLEFENEHMRVLRLTLKADEVSPVHDDLDALFVCIAVGSEKACHIRLTRPGGRSQDIHLQAGESRWVYGDTRSEKNLGTQPLEMLIIETK